MPDIHLLKLATTAEVLGAMITPALLISASGTLVLSTSNRLSRVVDRVRVLTRDAEQLWSAPLDPSTAPKRALISSQLGSLTERALILRSALAGLYTAIGLLVATSVGLGILTMVGFGTAWPPIALAILGACALLYGSVMLVREGRLAIGSTLEEMRYVQDVISVMPPGSKPEDAR